MPTREGEPQQLRWLRNSWVRAVDEETQKGHAEREKIIASGYAEIEAERNRAKEDLRKQVSALAVAGAQQILQREIDANAQNDIVEKLVAEL